MRSCTWLHRLPPQYCQILGNGTALNNWAIICLCCCLATKSCLPHKLQHARPPHPSLSPGVCSNLCPLSQWCHPNNSSSVTLFSSCLQSFLESGSFPVNQLFASGGQSIGTSASASVLPMNIQGWFPLGLTGLISLLSKGLSRVFSSTIIRKLQFLSAQPSLWSNSHIRTWLLEKPQLCLWRRKWQPTPVLLPRKFHGWRSLVGYSPWGRKQSDTTEWLHFTSLVYTDLCRQSDISAF